MELDIAAPVSDLVGFRAPHAVAKRDVPDKAAFSAVYREHYRAIGGYIYRRVGDSHLTEDLVADVFMLAFRAFPRYRERGLPMRAWLYRIATNRVNRWARRERRHSCEWLDSEQIGGGGVRSEAGLTPDYVRAALLTLAPKYQGVLALHYIEGVPVAQVALAIGCREGTVKSRLARGRDALRKRLAQRSS